MVCSLLPAVRYQLYALALFQFLLNQLRTIAAGEQHRSEGRAHSWCAEHGRDGQPDYEAIGGDFPGPFHHFLFRPRHPHSAVARHLLVEPALVQEVDHHGIMSGGIDHDFTLQRDRIDMDNIVAAISAVVLLTTTPSSTPSRRRIRSTTRVRFMIFAPAL